MPTRQLKEFLDRHKVKYIATTHSTAYTAQEIASLAHVRGDEFAKTVIVRIDGDLMMAVLSASCQVDLPLLKAAAHGKRFRPGVRDGFPRQVSGMRRRRDAPVRSPLQHAVFVDEMLTLQKEIAFNAGTPS